MASPDLSKELDITGHAIIKTLTTAGKEENIISNSFDSGKLLKVNSVQVVNTNGGGQAAEVSLFYKDESPALDYLRYSDTYVTQSVSDAYFGLSGQLNIAGVDEDNYVNIGLNQYDSDGNSVQDKLNQASSNSSGTSYAGWLSHDGVDWTYHSFRLLDTAVNFLFQVVPSINLTKYISGTPFYVTFSNPYSSLQSSFASPDVAVSLSFDDSGSATLFKNDGFDPGRAIPKNGASTSIGSQKFGGRSLYLNGVDQYLSIDEAGDWSDWSLETATNRSTEWWANTLSGSTYYKEERKKWLVDQKAVTIELWFKLQAISSSYQTIISKGRFGIDHCWTIDLNNQEVRIRANDMVDEFGNNISAEIIGNASQTYTVTRTVTHTYNIQEVIPEGSFQTDTWYHLAYADNSDNAFLYLNGVKVPISGRMVPDEENSAPIESSSIISDMNLEVRSWGFWVSTGSIVSNIPSDQDTWPYFYNGGNMPNWATDPKGGDNFDTAIVTIGASDHGSSNFFHGYIDDFRVYYQYANDATTDTSTGESYTLFETTYIPFASIERNLIADYKYSDTSMVLSNVILDIPFNSTNPLDPFEPIVNVGELAFDIDVAEGRIGYLGGSYPTLVISWDFENFVTGYSSLIISSTEPTVVRVKATDGSDPFRFEAAFDGSQMLSNEISGFGIGAWIRKVSGEPYNNDSTIASKYGPAITSNGFSPGGFCFQLENNTLKMRIYANGQEKVFTYTDSYLSNLDVWHFVSVNVCITPDFRKKVIFHVNGKSSMTKAQWEVDNSASNDSSNLGSGYSDIVISAPGEDFLIGGRSDRGNGGFYRYFYGGIDRVIFTTTPFATYRDYDLDFISAGVTNAITPLPTEWVTSFGEETTSYDPLALDPISNPRTTFIQYKEPVLPGETISIIDKNEFIYLDVASVKAVSSIPGVDIMCKYESIEQAVEE